VSQAYSRLECIECLDALQFEVWRGSCTGKTLDMGQRVVDEKIAFVIRTAVSQSLRR
jgi:hypothetical protein